MKENSMKKYYLSELGEMYSKNALNEYKKHIG